MNALTNTALCALTLITLSLNLGAALAQEPAGAEAAQVASKADQGDVGASFLAASAIEGAAHDAKCNLLGVVAPKEGLNRDLGLVSISDLAAGARVETSSLVDEVGFAVAIVGLNPVIQLTEENLLSSRVLITGRSLSDFVVKAERAGYTVFSESVSCQASIRQDDLASLARAIMKARKIIRSFIS